MKKAYCSRIFQLWIAIFLGLVLAALTLPLRSYASNTSPYPLGSNVDTSVLHQTPDVDRVPPSRAAASAAWPRRFAATAGTTVDSARPDLNLFNDDVVAGYTQIGENPGVSQMETWLDFDLSDIPASATIQAAHLTVPIYPGSSMAAPYIHAYPAQGAWAEDTLTWNTRPLLGGDAGSPQLPSPTALTFDLTDLVQEWVTGTTLEHGLALQSTGADGEWSGFLYSPDSVNPPDLMVTYTLSANDVIFAGLVQEVGFGDPADYPMYGIPMRLYASEVPGELGELVDEDLTNAEGEYTLHYIDTGALSPVSYTVVMSEEAYRVANAFPVDGSSPEFTPEGHLVFDTGTGPTLFEAFFHIEPIYVPPTSTLIFSGHVFYPGGGEPAAGVEVVVYRTTHDIDEPLQVMAGASTTADGSFRLPLIEPYEAYTYVVQVADTDYQVVLAEAPPGGWVSEDQRVVFIDPVIPGTYAPITFIVEPVGSVPTTAARSTAAATTEFRPMVAVLLTPQCTCGTVKCTLITNTHVLNAFEQTLFNTSGDSIRNFFLEMSQDRYSIEQVGLFQVIPQDDPATGNQNESDNCPKPEWPTTELHRAWVARSVLGDQINFDFGSFDADGSGTVEEDELIVLIAATDPDTGNARVRTSDPRSVRVGDVNVRVRYVMVQPGTDFSTIAHEITHATVFPGITGSPGDMYGGSGNAGTYGLMDNHCHGRINSLNPNVPYTPTQHIVSRRPHLDPWTKIQLGWITPTVITGSGWAYLDMVEDGGTVYRLQAPSGHEGEYFLIENRWPAGSGYETALPDSGLAIWHINEDLLPSQGSAVMLERAGGGANSGQATQFCDDDFDNTALWDGTEGFHSASSPSSDWHNGADSDLAVLCIGAPGPTVAAYLTTNWTQDVPMDGDEPNNSSETAVFVTPGTYTNRTLHAPCDSDHFLLPHWQDATITVTVEAFTDAAYTTPADPLQISLQDDNYYSSPAFEGTGIVTASFQFQGEVHITVYGAAQAVYYRMTITNSQGSMIPPDRYDTGSRNDAFITSAAITETIAADRLLAPGLTVYDLNLDSSGDQDYFTLQLPPAADPGTGQPECLPPGDPLLGNPAVRQGELTIDIAPFYKRSFIIRLYRSDHNEITSQATINGLQARLECPHDHLLADGKIIVYIDHAEINFYHLNAYYHRWYEYKELPDWMSLTDPPLLRELPTIWGPIRWVYPSTPWVQDDVLNGVANPPLPTEFAPFRWQSSLPLVVDVLTEPGQPLNVSLWNAEGEAVATAGPWARAITPQFQLVAPDMEPGWYALGFDGAEALTEFELRFHHWPVYLPMVMR